MRPNARAKNTRYKIQHTNTRAQPQGVTKDKKREEDGNETEYKGQKYYIHITNYKIQKRLF